MTQPWLSTQRGGSLDPRSSATAAASIDAASVPAHDAGGPGCAGMTEVGGASGWGIGG
ncbi:MAG: hypothetical protein AAGA99_18170 [Actinomycetota bacterium]